MILQVWLTLPSGLANSSKPALTLIIFVLYTLSNDQTEYQLCDWLSFIYFAGLALHESMPDAKTIWLFCEQLPWAGALARGYLLSPTPCAMNEATSPIGGQIPAATADQEGDVNLVRRRHTRGLVEGAYAPTSPTTYAA